MHDVKRLGNKHLPLSINHRTSENIIHLTSSIIHLKVTAVKQWAGSFQVVPTRPEILPFHDSQPNNDKSTAFNIKMNKERFHNQLALNLGYERIVKDKRITIQVDDSDDPWVTLKFQGRPEVIRIKASGEADAVSASEAPEYQKELKVIADAVHQAYIDSTESFLSCYNK